MPGFWGSVHKELSASDRKLVAKCPLWIAHWDGTNWNLPQTISPAGFTDLPSPLPGYSFRNDSFPALTVVSGSPKVVCTSYDTGVGRAYL